MTTFIPSTHEIFTDREGAVIPLSPQSLKINEVKSRRYHKPISSLKRPKFRRCFNRYAFTTR